MERARPTPVAELLSRVPVFGALAPESLERIAQVAVPRRLEPGEVLFREGDASDTCYVVRSGAVRAVRVNTGGRTITLATFGPEDFFGELAMFEDELRSATIEALEDTELVAVLGGDMRRLMGEHPEITVGLVIALGRRLRESNERLSRQSFQTVQSRVAGALRDLASRQAAVNGGDVVVNATQSDIAQLAGSSRESASRFLAVLQRAGVITQGRGRVVIHDTQALGRYVV
ncbi:MAG TPA: Crp/Fnr family transcriptional regulator [Solirubrobacteraceae bacterium]|nr:Crp/Fnr family transcriptional regulator [Solirubrobacteraceae bacterium]